MRVLLLGTSSGAGKTTVCAMLCRYLSRRGLDPAPFKALNLSLNSYATRDGGEIGIGQAFQAWSCGLEPETDMNPVLLKPSGGGCIQMVLNGRPETDITRDAPMDRDRALSEAVRAMERLQGRHGFLVCEGSGSPAELNMMDRDVANTGLMRATGIPTILVADIERGGAFAALYGTWLLIPEDLRPQLKGFVINRFRGDASILGSAIGRMEELTGMRCLGVIPHMSLRFPEEDSLSSSEGRMEGSDARSAFMANIDELTDACVAAGLDFDAILEIARGRSSPRGHPHGLHRIALPGDGVHGHRAAADEVQE